ncbi:MAG: polyprenyl synthetase family protein [Bacteroidaceae bacterium]|nr:polyprenyl synthetase family protein [Bacteroidaceae bacterium]
MNHLESIQAPVKGELKQFAEMFSAALSHENPLLNLALQHLKNRTGKQMRPLMVLLCARLTGQVNEAVLHAAVALELLHTASLVHDDVVDESDCRRGQLSVNALTNNKVAVLVGDYLLSVALMHAAQTGNTAVVSVVAQLGQTLADGELLQLANTKSEDFNEKTYYEVIRKKTASLFSACAQVGAILAGGNEDEVERMRRFGQLTGTCFQLRDDIFDFDDKADTGKPAGNDMKEGKLTLPVIHALNKAATPEMTALALAVRRGEATAEQIAELVSFTRQQEGIAYAEWAMDEFRYMASGLIPDNADKDVADALRLYVDYVAQRNK